MKENVHIIQKQRYEIKTRKQKVAMDMQNRIDDINTKHILQVLSSELDKYFSANEITVIEKIELDLGKMNIHMDNAEWTEKFFEKFHAQLSLKTVEKNNDKEERNKHAVTEWIWFLKYGMLSPESIYDSVAAILEELKLINDNDRNFLRSYFINESNTDIVRRLVANTDAEIKRFHIRLFFSKDIDQVFSEIDKLTSSDEEKSTLKKSYSSQQVWEKVFTQLFQKINEQTFSTADLISEIKELFSEKNKDNNAVAKTNNEKELSFSIKDRMDMDVRNILPANEIFISNAGLCLLAPWISSFFKQLNLIDTNEFVDTDKQQHAIYLLHYLITQEESPTEELLIFPKLLCGWPLQMPVINSYVITDHEKNECVDLLTSVVQNWTTLKNTSIDGLRGSFLQRSGKLTENGDQFILQPEQQSIDLLLEYVPWTFRYIRLPWMKKAVQVDWY